MRAFGYEENGSHPLDWLLTLAKLDQARPLGFLNFVCTNPPKSSNYGNKQVDFLAIRIGSSCWAADIADVACTELRQEKRLDSVAEFMDFLRCSSE